MATRTLLPATDLLRIRADSSLDPKRRSTLGQFFTSAPICQFMASLFTKIEGNIHLLDPGAGVGSLTAAFFDEALRRGRTGQFKITAYDIEPSVFPYLEDTFQSCLDSAISQGIEFNAELVPKDFILETASVFAHSLFFAEKERYSHVIINPPYKKISSRSLHRQVLRQANIETVNLYTGFLSLAIKCLKPEGEIVAIVPRSFCNGLYYQSFREFLLSEVSLQHIHIFENRNQAFSDNEVLQENIIFSAVKKGMQLKQDTRSYVTVTSSPAADFRRETNGELYATDMTVREVELDEIVKVGDRQKFIHISPSHQDQLIVNRLSCFFSTLDELELEVSTGPVVDFRLKEYLRQDWEEGLVPLLYPTHLGVGIDWPKHSKKPNAISRSEKSQSWLWKNQGSFVLTRRFSSKEESRRVTATQYDSSLPGEWIGFDNKINVFHRNKLGLKPAIARGLWVYLNSTLVDRYYRQFGGHTQVNATDLRSIHYPDLESLERLGQNAGQNRLSQAQIDRLLKEEIDHMTGTSGADPLQAQAKIEQALEILTALGMPKAQRNERSALTLLALINLSPHGCWQELERPLRGVTPIMEWCREIYGKAYAPNTRETFRRQTLHQFRDAGLVVYNPDQPSRAVNSPKACYQATPELQQLLTAYSTADWADRLASFLRDRPTLTETYAKARKMNFVPLKLAADQEIMLTPGPHSELIRDIVTEFGPRFAPGAELVYVGDTGEKVGYFKEDRLRELGVSVDRHGKLPDVILFDPQKNWLLLIESVTSHGPVDSKRHGELTTLFAQASADLVFVTSFPDRRTMAKYLAEISWETEVWIADSPTHMIHFNGDKFLGPHA